MPDFGCVSNTGPVSAALDAALTAGWVEITAPRDRLAVQILRNDLDPGESEALVVAQETHADLIIVDDLEARRMARTLGVAFIGTLGVLLAAKLNNHIPAVKPFIEHLYFSPTGSGRRGLATAITPSLAVPPDAEALDEARCATASAA